MKLLLPDAPLLAPDEPLSELEARLRGSNATIAQKEALDRIAALERRLRAALAEGVPPADYPALASVLDACQAAREVLTMVVPKP
ncbi:EscE/YscE/SsaE family type III secretion system needle protein co-chaperone [Acidovorax sp.]|uniref:EscE/YscE/SsaE family type III secretion system needle protein co-chaperone n=1 Tax=Acidovorax sp. TaxID=1872122 RepID=UPI0026317393|nr:EscE/YscE/SsaE family type III secretion system needle protein co-chaperone [Acidovorax sp.]